MSNLLRPVGPLPPKVYWVRRLVVLGVALVVVVLVAAVLSKVAGSGGKGGGAATAATPTPTVTEKASGTPEQCSAEQLKVSLAADRFAYSGEQKPKFSVEVGNGGSEPCLVDVNDKTLSIDIVSGKDKIWSSANCSEAEANLLLMRPEDRESVSKVWDRSRNDKKCSANLPAARAGTYRVQATLAGAKSEEIVFTLG